LWRPSRSPRVLSLTGDIDRFVVPLSACGNHGRPFARIALCGLWCARLRCQQPSHFCSSLRFPSLLQGTLRFGPVRVESAIVEHVVEAAKIADMDPALLMAIADKESSFAPKAKASTSSASGLFQFVEAAWFKALRSFGWRHGHEQEAKAIQGDDVAPQKRAELLRLRNDPYLSAVLAAEMLKHDGEGIASRLGRPLTQGETYLIHFLGPEDAERFMKKMDDDPRASAAALLPKAAKANKPIFYERQGRRMKDRSVREVHEAFEAMMDKRTSRYEDVEAKLPAGASAYTGQ
jgi:hypothetical protein